MRDGERLRADLTLLVVAVVWGYAFVAQRMAAAHVGFFLYNGLRFVLGALTLLVAARGRWPTMTRLERRGGMLVGLLLFAAVTLQQAGLQFTTAGKAGFVTGLYVVLVPLFLALRWRRWPRWSVGVASFLAAMGLFLLSTEGQFALALGDGLELAAALLWALHVICVGWLAGRVNPFRLALAQYLVCGLLSTLLGLVLEFRTLNGLVVAWWPVVYGGVFSVGLGYTLQVVGQKATPSTDAAIILSMEAVFAALFGWLALGETLTTLQLLGCGLMLSGMLLAQVSTFNFTPAFPERER